MKKKFCILLPCHDEESNIKPMYEALKKELEPLQDKYTYDCLFLNDGSQDNSLKEIEDLVSQHKNVFYIDFSRNFGKESVVYAGFCHALNYDFTVLMDLDFQNPPKTILEMIEKWELGYHDIYGHRVNRDTDSVIRRFLTNTFYKLTTLLSPFLAVGTDFRLMDKKVIQALVDCHEYYRYNKGLYNYVGFKKISVDYVHEERVSGDSKWGVIQLFGLAFSGIFSFSIKPLRVSILVGSTVSFFSFLYLVIIVFKTVFYGVDVPGYASLLSIMLLFQGFIMILLGVVGEYIGRGFMESKKRPTYFIQGEKLP